jgi:hypothetical protein
VTNSGTITGGNGGIRGTGSTTGSAGAGGVGIVGTGDDTVITSGAIAGALSGDGTTQADAIDFSGGGNTLVLEQGNSFTGNVVSTSGGTNGGEGTLGNPQCQRYRGAGELQRRGDGARRAGGRVHPRRRRGTDRPWPVAPRRRLGRAVRQRHKRREFQSERKIRLVGKDTLA